MRKKKAVLRGKLIRIGRGRSVELFVIEEPRRFIISFKRPIKREDVVEGKLRPIINVRREKSKVVTSLLLSEEAAQALATLLSVVPQKSFSELIKEDLEGVFQLLLFRFSEFRKLYYRA